MTPDVLSSLPATLADRWLVLRPVGEGGMATVYLGRDLKHDREVALKVMRPELSGALGHARFVREIQIAARLNHPHILPLFDSIEVADRLLFVMPYVAGESLRSRLEREGSLPIAEATEIARQVASALHYAHQQGVVHRDIKPENILLQSGQAVVTDFGIARAIDTTGGGAGRLTQTGMAIGTPRYMSPEQIAGEPIDGASDVYSLGCVLYEMLTGNPPFDGPTAHSLLARHALEQPSSPRTQRRDLTRELESIVLTALAKAPRQRFPTAGSMASALAGDTAVPARRGRLRRAAAMVATIAVAALGIWTARQLWRGAGPGGGGGARLAVLYLDNPSRDTTVQYLTDGITEEMIWRLGRIERLTVASRGAVRRFRGSTENPTDIGRALGVDYLVSGTVDRAESQARIRIELISAASGSHLWGMTFDPAVHDVLAVEDSIAQAVAGGVMGQLAPGERSILATGRTRNAAAYDHYIRGSFFLAHRRSEADGRQALREFEAALALDPDFPAALGRLGLLYGIYASWPWEFPGLTTDSLIARGLAAANRAIALDSSSADGWLARGFLLIPGPADSDASDGFAVGPNLMGSALRCWSRVPSCGSEAASALSRAVQLAPRDGEVWYQYGRAGFLEELLGAMADSSALMRSLALEPSLAVAAWLLGWRHLANRRLVEAESMLDSAIALGRRDLSVYGLRLETRLARGNVQGALEDLEVVRGLVGVDTVAQVFHGVMRVAIHARAGDSALARDRLDSLALRFPPETTRRRSIRIALAAAYATVGAADRSLGLLERVLDDSPYPLLVTSSLWHPVREHPRFRRIIERAGTLAPAI